MEYKKLITGGCSHSSTHFGVPWTEYIADRFTEHLTYAESGGAVNSYVEKIIHAVSLNPNSFVIAQLTYPERLTLGLSSLDGIQTSRETNFFRDSSMFGFTYDYEKNFNNVSKLFKDYGIDKNVELNTFKFLTEQIVLSNFTLSITYQSILALISTCHLHNCELLMFTWGKPIDDYFTEHYRWIKEKANFIPSSASHFFQNNNILPTSDNFHYGSQAHNRLAKEYILPYLNKLLSQGNKQLI
jgi:hypothetical protein